MDAITKLVCLIEALWSGMDCKHRLLRDHALINLFP